MRAQERYKQSKDPIASALRENMDKMRAYINVAYYKRGRSTSLDDYPEYIETLTEHYLAAAEAWHDELLEDWASRDISRKKQYKPEETRRIAHLGAISWIKRCLEKSKQSERAPRINQLII